MDRNEHVALASVVDFLESGNIAAAKALLSDIVYPGQERPPGLEYPKWVDHPTGDEPSQIANSHDHEQQILTGWENSKQEQGGQESGQKRVTRSAGPIPAPGTSVPPLPGDTSRPQEPEFPAKDDVRPNADPKNRKK
jgi:hypothetical protein